MSTSSKQPESFKRIRGQALRRIEQPNKEEIEEDADEIGENNTITFSHLDSTLPILIPSQPPL